MIGLLSLAWRSFARNLRRYRVLLTALTLAVGVLVFVLGAAVGMRDALRAKAGRYFAGDVVVLGFAGDGRSLMERIDAVERAVATTAQTVPVLGFSRRSTYYDPFNTQLFHAGYYIRQRRVVGVEWDLERPVLETFDFLSGGVPAADETHAALISATAAEQLSLRVGDEMIVSIVSDRGRANTAGVVVRGIFAESSFFGFTTYIERRTLNTLREAHPDTVNEVGLYLQRAIGDEARAAATLTAALEAEGLPSFGVLAERAAYEAASGTPWPERTYGAVTLQAQLDEINELLGALAIIAVVIVVFFLIIVAVGVSNTYSMIVFERTREIGTLRALGLQRGRATALFLIEALYLGAGGVMIGATAGIAALAAVQHWGDFGTQTWATLFLVRSRLHWHVPLAALGGIAALAVLSSLVGCLRAAVRAGRVHPAEALRQE